MRHPGTERAGTHIIGGHQLATHFHDAGAQQLVIFCHDADGTAVGPDRRFVSTARTLANDQRHRPLYDSNHQYCVRRCARDYAMQLGGGTKAVRDDHSRHYLDDELAASIRAMVRATLDEQREQMAAALADSAPRTR